MSKKETINQQSEKFRKIERKSVNSIFFENVVLS